MVDCVNRHGGVVDKLMGDAVMTVFGIPFCNDNDALNAVSCAIDMQHRINQLNETEKGPIIRAGIGISYGKVDSGNIGTQNRFEYTVNGDPVNLASRLESDQGL